MYGKLGIAMVIVSVLTACGSGGGGGGGENPKITLQASPSTIAGSEFEGENQELSFTLTKLSGPDYAPLHFDIEGAPAVLGESIGFQKTSETTYSVAWLTAASAPVGKFEGDLQIRACSTAACTSEYGRATAHYDVEVRSHTNLTELQTTNTGWEGFQRDAGHTGYVPITVTPSEFSPRWRFAIPNFKRAFTESYPVVAPEGDLVYLASAQGSGTSANAVYAIGESDGQLKWTFTAPPTATALSAAAANTANPGLYVSAYDETGGTLYGLNPANGAVRFQAATGESSTSAPITDSGTLLAAMLGPASATGIAAYDHNTGTQLWEEGDLMPDAALVSGFVFHYGSNVSDPMLPPVSPTLRMGGRRYQIMSVKGQQPGPAASNIVIAQWDSLQTWGTGPIRATLQYYDGEVNKERSLVLDGTATGVTFEWSDDTLRLLTNVIVEKRLGSPPIEPWVVAYNSIAPSISVTGLPRASDGTSIATVVELRFRPYGSTSEWSTLSLVPAPNSYAARVYQRIDDSPPILSRGDFDYRIEAYSQSGTPIDMTAYGGDTTGYSGRMRITGQAREPGEIHSELGTTLRLRASGTTPGLTVFNRTGTRGESIADPGSSLRGNVDPSVVGFRTDSGVRAVGNGGDRIVDFDLNTSRVRWTVQAPAPADDSRLTYSYAGTPAVAHGTVFAQQLEPHPALLALSEADGVQLWSWAPASDDRHFVGSPVVTDNLIFVSTDRAVYAIDLGTHQSVWTYPRGGKLAISSKGVLYITRVQSNAFDIPSAVSDGYLAAINLQ